MAGRARASASVASDFGEDTPPISDASEDEMFSDAISEPIAVSGETYTSPGVEIEEEAPKPSKTSIHNGPREDTSDLIAMIYGGVGYGLQKLEVSPAAGRAMKLQAPLAASRIDQIINGTIVDRFLQPLVSQVGQLEELAQIVAFPLLIAVIEHKPELAASPMIMGIVEDMITSNLAQMGPLLAKQKKDKEAQERALADFSDVLGFKAEDGPPAEQVWKFVMGIGEDE